MLNIGYVVYAVYVVYVVYVMVYVVYGIYVGVVYLPLPLRSGWPWRTQIHVSKLLGHDWDSLCTIFVTILHLPGTIQKNIEDMRFGQTQLAILLSTYNFVGHTECARRSTAPSVKRAACGTTRTSKL